MMMSVEEWKRVDRMPWEEYLKWCESLGIPSDFSGDVKSYQLRLRTIARLQTEGKGPGAYFEREMHEIKRRHHAQGLDAEAAIREMQRKAYAGRNR